ncbi:unnamed protein product [Moneuplotes crassus]|uniref:Uncharacterized protein n=1 Tax=Euplotes crassus TaxID=5936 RepID=A0AAD1XIC4_EUPCR|nr:unnamed protein product [Moneuplotes crassus]
MSSLRSSRSPSPRKPYMMDSPLRNLSKFIPENIKSHFEGKITQNACIKIFDRQSTLSDFPSLESSPKKMMFTSSKKVIEDIIPRFPLKESIKKKFEKVKSKRYQKLSRHSIKEKKRSMPPIRPIEGSISYPYSGEKVVEKLKKNLQKFRDTQNRSHNDMHQECCEKKIKIITPIKGLTILKKGKMKNLSQVSNVIQNCVLSIDTSRYLNLPSVHHFPKMRKEQKNGPIEAEILKNEEKNKKTDGKKHRRAKTRIYRTSDSYESSSSEDIDYDKRYKEILRANNKNRDEFDDLLI